MAKLLNSNPYFESTVFPWAVQSGGTIARSTAQSHEGVASLLLTPDGVTATSEVRSEIAPGVIPFRWHMVSAWVRCAVSRAVSVNLVWRDAAGTFLSSAGAVSVSVTANTWTLVSLMAIAPASAEQGQISLSMGGTPLASHLLHVDEAKLERLGLDVTSTYNNSFHSPGFDLEVSGLTGYDTLNVERVSVPGSFGDTPVRGADDVAIGGDLFGLSDYEAPINDATFYRATATSDVFLDDFDRIQSGGFGMGPFLTQYTVLSGPTADFSVNFTPGASITLPTSSVEHRIQPVGLNLDEFDIILPMQSTHVAAGALIVAALHTNYQDGNNHYVFEVSFETSGQISVLIRKVVAGVPTNLGVASSVLPYSAGTPFFVRMYRSGTELRMKAWSGTPATEPASWNITAADSTFGAGGLVLRAVSGAGNTNPSPAISFASLTITKPSGNPVMTAVAESATYTIASLDPGAVWLKSVAFPTLSRRVNIVDFDDTRRPGRVLGEYEVLGRRNKVVLTDVMGGREGSFTVATFPSGGTWWSDSHWRDLQALLAEGGPLLLQMSGADLTGEEDMYLAVTNVSRKRVGVIGGELVHLHTIDYIEVDRPASANQILSLRTWQDVIDQNASWQEVIDNYSTWLEVLQRDR